MEMINSLVWKVKIIFNKSEKFSLKSKLKCNIVKFFFVKCGPTYLVNMQQCNIIKVSK